MATGWSWLEAISDRRKSHDQTLALQPHGIVQIDHASLLQGKLLPDAVDRALRSNDPASCPKRPEIQQAVVPRACQRVIGRRVDMRFRST